MSCTDKLRKNASLWIYVVGKGFREEDSFESIRREVREVTKMSKVTGVEKAMVESGWTGIKMRLGNNKNKKGERNSKSS